MQSHLKFHRKKNDLWKLSRLRNFLEMCEDLSSGLFFFISEGSFSRLELHFLWHKRFNRRHKIWDELCPGFVIGISCHIFSVWGSQAVRYTQSKIS